jgi:hypothetical protein
LLTAAEGKEMELPWPEESVGPEPQGNTVRLIAQGR